MRCLTYGAMLAIACLGLCTTSACADQIGIKFEGRIDATHNSDALAPGDVAGVIPQNNWNNDATLVGSPGTHTLSQLMDSTGTHTSVSLSVNANDSWFSGSGNADPNHALLNGIIKASSSQPTATYTFNGLTPGGTYTLIAYTMEDTSRTNNTLTVGSTKYITTAQTGADFTGAFVRAMNTDPNGTRDVGNYVEFDSVMADSNGRLVLTDHWDGTPTTQNGAGIAGIQLETPAQGAVPEPASVVLFGLGTWVLIVWRGRGSRKR
jgi:PEP-CTERM motif